MSAKALPRGALWTIFLVSVRLHVSFAARSGTTTAPAESKEPAMSGSGLPDPSGVGAPSPDGKGLGPRSPTGPATPNPIGQSPRAAVPLSNARAEASRRNGARSRGPKTAEDKTRSAQNALKHGMRALRYVVLRSAPRARRAPRTERTRATPGVRAARTAHGQSCPARAAGVRDTERTRAWAPIGATPGGLPAARRRGRFQTERTRKPKGIQGWTAILRRPPRSLEPGFVQAAGVVLGVCG
jgi:hypothetical protein